MKKKFEKINKKFKVHVPDLNDKNEHARVKNVLLVFLAFQFFVFSFLFWAEGKKVIDESSFEPPPGPSAMEIKTRRILKGSPMAKMTSYIAQRDERTAAYLMAIAKKESNWGKYAPKKGKKECYNYWGYRGSYNQTSSGYSCFDSERQAVQVVGNRIEELIDQGIDTPEEMIVWKCGGSCQGHSPESVRKWSRDVGFYYEKIRS